MAHKLATEVPVGKQWRRERDSNPRSPLGLSGFQDRLFQPLTHPSAGGSAGFYCFKGSSKDPCIKKEGRVLMEL